MEYVCRKPGLTPGMDDVGAGCGWGALALHMANHDGVRVRAFNISSEQNVWARYAVEVEVELSAAQLANDRLSAEKLEIYSCPHRWSGETSPVESRLFYTLFEIEPLLRSKNHASALVQYGANAMKRSFLENSP